MTFAAPNSPQARDIASLIHPQTNLARHREQGPEVMARGEGVTVYDDSGQAFLDAAGGLWCASLGFANERLGRVAYEQMRRPGCYHLYRGPSNETCIELVTDKPSRRPFAAADHRGTRNR
jgi:4-aminobutyrate--pyruvate transaminase